MIFDDDTPEISEQTQDGVAESAPDSTGDGAADVSELGGQVIELVADQLSEDASNITPASRFPR